MNCLSCSSCSYNFFIAPSIIHDIAFQVRKPSHVLNSPIIHSIIASWDMCLFTNHHRFRFIHTCQTFCFLHYSQDVLQILLGISYQHRIICIYYIIKISSLNRKTFLPFHWSHYHHFAVQGEQIWIQNAPLSYSSSNVHPLTLIYSISSSCFLTWEQFA